MIEFVKSLLLWLAVLIPSVALASIAATKKPKSSPFIMQISAAAVSVLLITFLKIPISFAPRYLPQALVLGLLLSPLVFSVKEEPEQEFFPEGLLGKVILLLLLAPIGEELWYRGLVEGYLLQNHFWSAMVFAAFLFGASHAFSIAFEKSVRKKIALSAFLIGIALGYIRAVSGSILPAIVLHAMINGVSLAAKAVVKS